MRFKFLAFAFIASLFVFVACEEKPKSELDRAAFALAESSCLLFDSEVPLVDVAEKAADIIVSYGFTDATEINSYINEIRDTEEENLLKIALRNAMKESCGDELEKRGLNVLDVTEAMLSEE